jgi:GDP-L-fucose synthase
MKVLIFGSKGMVGSSVARNLNLSSEITLYESSRKDTNLFSFEATKKTIEAFEPNIIINSAAKVGGIMANNTKRSEFIINNLKINMNIIESIIKFPEVKLVNLGSSCIYPLEAKNPISENSLMTGVLEPTNSPYAMAKLTAIEMGDALTKEFGHKIINLMPTNLYGPNDNFSDNESHVIPGLISRMHKAKESDLKEFTVWGTGSPLREFLHVDDLAEAIRFIMLSEIHTGIYNIGSNHEVSIKELVEMLTEVIGFNGNIVFDTKKPDGNPRKLLDSTKIRQLGWEPKIDLMQGLNDTYKWYINNIN